MRNIKTARGKTLDMGALVKKNENATAVGNVRMNARGDRLNSDGTVKKTVQAISKEQAEATEPPVEQSLSDIGNTPTVKADTMPEAPTASPEPVVVNSRIVARDDGTEYEEVEYSDGSFETREMGNPNEF